MVDFARIKDMCWDKRTTIAGLEHTLGFSNGTISKWKKSNPRIDNLQKVANFFGCSVLELILDEPATGDNETEKEVVVCQD